MTNKWRCELYDGVVNEMNEGVVNEANEGVVNEMWKGRRLCQSVWREEKRRGEKRGEESCFLCLLFSSFLFSFLYIDLCGCVYRASEAYVIV
jgi:hypothetical protein